MKNNTGELVILSESRKYSVTLSVGTHIIGMQDDEPIIVSSGGSIAEYNSVFLVSVNDCFVEISPISGTMKVNDKVIVASTKIKESDKITINNQVLCFDYKINYLQQYEELIDLYLDGQLPDFIDVKKMFLNYADLIKITKKQAAFILASIDIPEVET